MVLSFGHVNTNTGLPCVFTVDGGVARVCEKGAGSEWRRGRRSGRRGASPGGVYESVETEEEDERTGIALQQISEHIV